MVKAEAPKELSRKLKFTAHPLFVKVRKRTRECKRGLRNKEFRRLAARKGLAEREEAQAEQTMTTKRQSARWAIAAEADVFETPGGAAPEK